VIDERGDGIREQDLQVGLEGAFDVAATRLSMAARW